MKILAVVVDEIAESCYHCPFVVMGTKLMCITNRKTFEDTLDKPMVGRPSWCPLTTHYMASLIRGEGDNV